MSQVKGVSFKSVMTAVEVLHGASAAEACLAELPGELAAALRYRSIVATGWYPIEWYRALLHSVRNVSGLGEPGLYAIGRQCAKQDMTGIYRLGFKLLAPETVLGLSTRLFSNYYDTGKSRVIESRPGFAHVRWWDCAGFDRNMWCEAFGAAEMFMQLAGAATIRSRPVWPVDNVLDRVELTMHWV